MTGKQVDRFLDILDRLTKVAERWADREYPTPDENAEAEVYTAGKPDEPQSKEEYDQFNPPGRFQQKFTDTHSV